ncbi:fimbria/pilus outer membrane usher protein [Methylococcus sp. S1M]|uniref:fimbria/pilus outer membrane usher protein n=1 Tax=Methylococcus sp. S1M TaxID=3438966 RepID=UPI003F5083D5
MWRGLECSNPALVAALLLLMPIAGRSREEAELQYAASDSLSVTAVVRPPSPAGTAQPPEDREEHLLAVELNGETVSEGTLVLRGQDGSLYVPEEAIESWRMELPAANTLAHDGRDYRALANPGIIEARIDDTRQTLVLRVEPSLLAGTVVEAGTRLAQPKAERASFAGFLNYDFNIMHSRQGDFQGGALELGISNRYGLATSAFLARHNSGQGGSETQFTRLYTTWIMDDPANMASLQLGDNIVRPWQRGYQARFAGIQYATNFGLQPRFYRYPQPAVTGSLTEASSLDIFLNGALVDQQNLPAGPFQIRDLPAANGSGEIRVVARDLLGREQVITQPFYVGSSMLREGLVDFSYEAGFLRRYYGTDSMSYGAPFGSATYRRGLNSWLTGELHGQVVRDQVAVATGGSFLIGTYGVVDAAVGISAGRGWGGLGGLGFLHQGETLSYGASSYFASQSFTQLGIEQGKFAPKQLSDAFCGFTLTSGSSVSLRYGSANYFDRPHIDTYVANYTQNLWGGLTLSLAAVYTRSDFEGAQVAAIFTLPLGERTYATANARATRTQGGPTQLEFDAQYTHTPGWGPGWGYRLDAGTNDCQAAQLTAQTTFGLFSAEVAHLQGDFAERAFGSGGIGLIEGHPFLSRQIQDGFAIAKVGDYKDVRVYADNQLIGQTDEEGYVVLPRLRAYDVNNVQVEGEDLPMDAQVGTLALPVTPYFRSGVVVDFPIRRSRGATLTILLEDGQPIPAGATVTVEGVADVFPVGMDGEVYLTGLSPRNEMKVEWNGKRCTIVADYPESAEILPDLGKFVCAGVHR